MKELGKIKIYEIAKKLDIASKEVIKIANQLNIGVKSHASGVTEEEANKIEEKIKKENNNKKISQNKENKQEINKDIKKEEKQPVIIRREVIINE